MRRAKKATLAAFLAITGKAAIALADGEFEGKWKVTDTSGKPFEIVLMADGSANGTRDGEGMEGTWKQDGSTATITWNTGWTTKIIKEGDHYKKAAYDKGQALDGPPANTSEAEKQK